MGIITEKEWAEYRSLIERVTGMPYEEAMKKIKVESPSVPTGPFCYVQPGERRMPGSDVDIAEEDRKFKEKIEELRNRK